MKCAEVIQLEMCDGLRLFESELGGWKLTVLIYRNETVVVLKGREATGRDDWDPDWENFCYFGTVSYVYSADITALQAAGSYPSGSLQ